MLPRHLRYFPLIFVASSALGEAHSDGKPGITTRDYISLSAAERNFVIIGATHILARWMRQNGEEQLNCFYGTGTYTDVSSAIDAYIEENPVVLDDLFSETLIDGLEDACGTDMSEY